MKDLTAREIVNNAREILIDKYLASGMSEDLSKSLAMYAMYGMLSTSVSKEKAKQCLEIAEEWE